MEWDQRAFAWLYRALRRVGTSRGPPAGESVGRALAPRLQTFARLLSPRQWDVGAGRGMGGVAPGRLLLPDDLRWLPDPDDQILFCLYRIVVGVTAVDLGWVPPEGSSGRQRALAMLIGAPHARRALCDRFAGGRALVARCERTLLDRFPFEEGAADARCVSAVCKAILLGSCGEVRDDSEASTMVRALLDAASQAHTWPSLENAALGFEGALAKMTGGRASGEYRSPWGLLLPVGMGKDATLEAPGSPLRALPNGTEREMRRRPADVEKVDLDSQKDRDNPLVHSFEKVHTATEYQGGRKQLDGSDRLDEQEEALQELELTKVVRTSEPARSVYRADLRAELDAGELPDGPGAPRTHRYPEWNATHRRYRADWCTVHEQGSPASSPLSTVTSASRRLRGDVLRLQGELKRLELERRWRNRQLDGTEIDVDALVDRHADLKAGRRPDRRIYVRRKRHDRDLAMLVLVDASASSDAWVSGKRVFDLVRDAAQVLVESFEPLSPKLCLGAFYSNTRRDCRFVIAKTFGEPVVVGLRRLHALAPTGYTRIGPALRHATSVLDSSGARRRLILLLTDGKPTDYDRYEGQYGIEDVRQSLREAADQSTQCLALTVRDSSDAYLTQMFGAHGWMLLPSVETLSSRFVSVARDFLRS